MLNIDDFYFGVEVEFADAPLTEVVTMMRNALAHTGIEVRQEGWNHITRPYWKVTTDATVTRHRNYSRGEGFGGELVSPVLRGSEGFRHLKAVLDALNQHPQVNIDSRCGLHVHLSWDNMQTVQIQNAVQRYARYESIIDSWMPPSRRAGVNSWCASINGNGYPLQRVASYNGSVDGLAGLAGRYYKVNLQSLALNSHGTIEFRQHSGSTEFSKIEQWVKFLMNFVAASDTVPQDVTTYHRHKRSGNAFGEVRELFAARGWELKYASRGTWKLSDENQMVIDEFTNDDLFGFYVDGVCDANGHASRRAPQTLNQSFANYWSGKFGQITDDVFRGVGTDTQAYLESRIQHFAQQAA